MISKSFSDDILYRRSPHGWFKKKKRKKEEENIKRSCSSEVEFSFRAKNILHTVVQETKQNKTKTNTSIYFKIHFSTFQILCISKNICECETQDEIGMERNVQQNVK